MGQRRFEYHSPVGQRTVVLTPDHPAVINGTTLFPARVGSRPPAQKRAGPQPALKSGFHSRKIGARITKGAWTGMPIFTLTLEERATCPRSCQHWLDCYGNKMQWSPRQVAGPALEARIEAQLDDLNREYPNGFVVRLHVLGDFYSLRYVQRWALWLAIFPALRVYGYTAWQVGSDIGDAVSALRARCAGRFMVRHSDADAGFRSLTVKCAEESGDAIVCPAQSHAKADAICCATCALCWSTERAIAFLAH